MSTECQELLSPKGHNAKLSTWLPALQEHLIQRKRDTHANDPTQHSGTTTAPAAESIGGEMLPLRCQRRFGGNK